MHISHLLPMCFQSFHSYPSDSFILKPMPIKTDDLDLKLRQLLSLKRAEVKG